MHAEGGLPTAPTDVWRIPIPITRTEPLGTAAIAGIVRPALSALGIPVGIASVPWVVEIDPVPVGVDRVTAGNHAPIDL